MKQVRLNALERILNKEYYIVRNHKVVPVKIDSVEREKNGEWCVREQVYFSDYRELGKHYRADSVIRRFISVSNGKKIKLDANKSELFECPHDAYQSLLRTHDTEREVAELVLKRHNRLITFLKKILGIR